MLCLDQLSDGQEMSLSVLGFLEAHVCSQTQKAEALTLENQRLTLQAFGRRLLILPFKAEAYRAPIVHLGAAVTAGGSALTLHPLHLSGSP